MSTCLNTKILLQCKYLRYSKVVANYLNDASRYIYLVERDVFLSVQSGLQDRVPAYYIIHP